MLLQVQALTEHEPGEGIQDCANDEAIAQNGQEQKMGGAGGARRKARHDHVIDRACGEGKAEDGDDLQDSLDDKVEHDGKKRLVGRKAVADGDGRVEQEAGRNHRDEQHTEKLEHIQKPVHGVIAVHVLEGAADELRQSREHAVFIDGKQNGQRVDTEDGDEPKHGHEKLCP